jgi:hypothetical protein
MRYATSARLMGTAFGLELSCDSPLSFLVDSSTEPTGRALKISLEADAADGWPSDAEFVCDDRERDGRLVYQIGSHPEAGFLIAGPDFGRHLLSPDGRRVVCDPAGRPESAWQRLLVAQVLPFAALLQGLEVFHASAVVSRGAAVALLGASRAGKTSTALELCRRGATFLADDVLALESSQGALRAFPGTPIAGVDRTRVATGSMGQSVAGKVIGDNAREHIVRMGVAERSARLGALFFLDRRADGPAEPRFEPSAEAQLLLAATFNFVLATPQRLSGLLDVCAQAAQLPVERVVSGPSTSVSQLGEAIDRRLLAVS